MNEGRRTQVVLLDDRRLEFLVQPKLIAGDLLDLVTSHFNLKEKEYFGLAFNDETGHYNWLQHDRKVMEHEFPKRSGTLVLYFKVRFFVESITILRDSVTVELFYLQAKQSVFNGELEVDTETAFELAAHVLQATQGDFTSDYAAKNDLKKLPVLPTSALKEHPSLTYCEDRVLYYYKRISGETRGQAIVNYMSIAESLPTYGVHYYEVKDKSGLPWWLGLSFVGIGQYDITDKITPRKIFQWRQLENLYFRERKFSIEVHDPRRVVHALSSFNLYDEAIEEPLECFDDLSDAISDPTTQVSLSRRTFGPSHVTVHAWYGNIVLVKSMWAMAISQHQFHLDRKQTKAKLPAFRSLNEIAVDLTESRQSLTSKSSQASDLNLTFTNSSVSLSAMSNGVSTEELESQQAAQKEMVLSLKSRKEVLEERLKLKILALKDVCIKEAEIIGELPAEYPLLPGEPLPQVRRRVGTAFQLSENVVNRRNNAEDKDLHRLEMEYELQSKITSAAMSLANDPRINKKVRKSRKDTYKKSAEKLQDLEKKLHNLKLRMGYSPAILPPRAYQEEMSSSTDDNVSDKSQPIFIGPPATPPAYRKRADDHIRLYRSPEVERSPSTRSSSTSRSRSPGPIIGIRRRPSAPVNVYYDNSSRPENRYPGRHAHRTRDRTAAKWRSQTPEPPKVRPQIMQEIDDYEQPPRPSTPVVLYPDKDNMAPESSPPPVHTAVFTFPESPPKRPTNFDGMSQSSNSPAPNRHRHASSTSNLSGKGQHDLLPFDNPEYHQQPTSLSQPPSPRKQVMSLGHLQNKSNSLPGKDKEHSYHGYKPFVSRTTYRSQHYPTYSTTRRATEFSPKQFEFDEVNMYINQPYNPDDEISSETSSSKQGSLDDRTHSLDVLRNDDDEPPRVMSRASKSMEMLRDADLSIVNSGMDVIDYSRHEPDYDEEPSPMHNVVRATKSMEVMRDSNLHNTGYIAGVSRTPRTNQYPQYMTSSSQTHYDPTPVRPHYSAQSPGYGRRMTHSAYRSMPSSPAHHPHHPHPHSSSRNTTTYNPPLLKPAEFHTATSTSVRPSPVYATIKVANKVQYQPIQPMTCEAVKPVNSSRR
ncbi:uncharacterized protein LOC144438775 isoform X4 [Glandiceps talaboti]